MACQTWSLSGLVAAFLDLAIAYLLLCASSVAYLASKFLGFFGLNLPCPCCDGIFFNKIVCLNRLLVEFPAQRVSDVLFSVKQRFPFSDPTTHDYSVGIGGGDNFVNGILEMSARAGKYDVKGKGLISNRPRSRLRYRKGKYLSVGSSCDRNSKGGDGFIMDGSLAVDNGEAHYPEYDDKAPLNMGLRQRSITSVGNYFPNDDDDDDDMHKKKIYIEELQDSPQGVPNFSGDEQNATKPLEQALAEERIARAALYIELEKERSAAASAADEAMAMILRLQEEKASIEIEARQYQRILEEKSAYDAEEMNILKEIVLRREKEKLFLEKEVEAYREMVSTGNEQLVTMERECSDGVGFMDKRDCELLFENESPFRCGDEKIIVTCNGTETQDPNYDPSSKHEAKDQMLDKDPQVYDVHIIGDGINVCSETTEYRKSSLSEVESEMLKIDFEVKRLQERLKSVQDGRDKLSRERENLQMKLLEDIACQVQEIRQLTESGKDLRQLSLPLPTSKVLSEKRRSRSVSSGLQKSNEGVISS